MLEKIAEFRVDPFLLFFSLTELLSNLIMAFPVFVLILSCDGILLNHLAQDTDSTDPE
jgi:hypothetical protein